MLLIHKMLAELWICLIFVSGSAVGTYNADVLSLRSGVGIGDPNVFDPVVRPSKTVEVSVGLTVLGSVELNTDDSTLSLNGKLIISWDTGGVLWTPSSHNNIDLLYVEADEMWAPSLVIENAAAENGVISDNKLSKLYANGNRTWEPFFNTNVYCDMDLTFYPFDQHRCRVVVAARSYTPDEVFFTLSDPVVSLNQYLSNHQWSLNPVVETDVFNETTSTVIFYFSLTRQTDHLRLVLFLPLIFLSALSLMVFLLPAENGQKAQFCAMLLFIIAVYMILAKTYIPVSNNLPLMVIYLLIVFILTALCIGCTCWVINIYFTETSRKMSTASVTILRYLSSLTCYRHPGINGQDDKTTDEESGNRNTSVVNTKDSDDSKPEVPKTSQFPPVGGVGGSLENGHSFPPPKQLPPVSTYMQKLKHNKVRPKSQTSVTSVRSNDAENKKCDPLMRKHLANCLDRLFFYLFLIVNIFVHCIFVAVISTGR